MSPTTIKHALLAAALLPALALAVPGCAACGGGDDDTPVTDPDGGPPELDAAPDAYVPHFDECAADGQAFVRNAYQVILGHKPRSQAEVDVYTAIYDQIAAGGSGADPREVVARALMKEGAYVDRWATYFMDALRVQRIEDQNQSGCFAFEARDEVTDELALYIRDNLGTDTGTGQPFTMLDALKSSLVLDDLSPAYRANLYSLVSFPITAANVPPREAELARREDFGLTFDSVYLNRDIVCLGCHNTEFSVTDNGIDPAADRHWPLDGLVEQAVFGMSTGIDNARAHAPFRWDGFNAFFDQGAAKPWGWSSNCGTFYPGPDVDIAGVDGYFASLRGQRLTVYELEGILRDGFESLRSNGLQIGADNEVADPDAAFAFLVASSIVEDVWKEVIGSGLTIANYFPRNQAARDLLQRLSDDFVRNGYSLQDLLVDIVTSDFFNRLPPEAGCGGSAYNYPNVFDPWVISDDDESRRLNGPGDAVAAISARALMRTAYTALEWGIPGDLDFPGGSGGGGGGDPDVCTAFSCPQLDNACNNFDQCCATFDEVCNGGGGGAPSFAGELSFQTGVGAFLKNGERGFRGLDFQARLVWEDRFGSCANPRVTDDFIDRIVTAANASAAATLGDVIAAVKDRLIGEPVLALEGVTSETAALEELFGSPLGTLASTVPDLGGRVRAFCGVLTSSPQFVLTGLAGRGSATIPALTPTEFGFAAVCTGVATRGLGANFSAVCNGDSITVSAVP